MSISKYAPICLALIILLSGQTNLAGQRYFHYHEIAQNLKTLRKAALEHVAIAGNNSPEGDQRIIDTLKMFLGQNVPQGTPRLWPGYHKEIKNLQIRGANWQELPDELSAFHHLFELSFVHCPNITLQGINDQIKKRCAQNQEDVLYKKFKNDIVSLGFYETDFVAQDSCHLDAELMEELRELRFGRIGNFNRHCKNLLTEINKAYPSLGWLTIECSKLDDIESLLPLRSFKKLKSLSLPRNYLSQMPPVPESLQALDVSFNFLNEFPAKTDSTSLKKLSFLYLDCNLFDYFKLYKVLTDTILDDMEVFSYDPCNFENGNELKLISQALDKRKIAVYMPFVERYHNDFSPAPPDCLRCQSHRDDFISSLLQEVVFTDSTGAQSHISFESGSNRVLMRSLASDNLGGNQFFMYRQLKSCIRNFADPADNTQVWDWQLCFWIEDPNSMQHRLKKLELLIKNNTGRVDWEDVEER
jgi:hypothetical protein